MRTLHLFPFVAASLLSISAFAQEGAPKKAGGMNDSVRYNSTPLIPNLKPSEPNFDVMYFNTRIGSFKIVGPGNEKPRGTVTIQCHGSVLISGLEGTVLPVNMQKELDDPKLDKQVYFGKGRLVIKGKFKNIQFFGRDLQGVWDGFGIIRFYGEFDKNLETGFFWYADDPEKIDWGNSGATRTNPPSKSPLRRGPGTSGPKIKVQDQG